MPRRWTRQHRPAAGSARRERIFCPSGTPGGGLAKGFIMQNPAPPPWGPEMEQQLRDRLTADGFLVGRCQCLEIHPVVAIRLRGPAELEVREMKQRIRKLAKDLGHRAPPGGVAITGRAGKFDGAFVMKVDF